MIAAPAAATENVVTLLQRRGDQHFGTRVARAIERNGLSAPASDTVRGAADKRRLQLGRHALALALFASHSTRQSVA